MENDLDLSISDHTFRKISELKKKLGFGEKSWDQMFDYIYSQNLLEEHTKNDIEKIMRKIHYESFDEWVENFALNLNHIWNEKSARELDPTKNKSIQSPHKSAIVIGRGPSIKKHNHLELIAKSNFEGSIVCCDGALITTLKAGVTPDKFPNFYVVSIDPRDVITKYYDDLIIDKFGPKINGIFSTLTHPSTIDRARKAGIKIHWLHTLFDYEEGEKSFNQIASVMVRTKNHKKGLPAIQTGGNVGTSSWFVSWQILKCNTIALIGINHGWNEDDPWKLIVTHGRENLPLEIDKNNPSVQKLFPKIYNPEFNCHCILDPTFQYYRTALIEFISRSPSWLSTINATEGGSIFGERIKCTTLKNFLESRIK